MFLLDSWQQLARRRPLPRNRVLIRPPALSTGTAEAVEPYPFG
jgi:hypothetical protein